MKEAAANLVDDRALHSQNIMVRTGLPLRITHYFECSDACLGTCMCVCMRVCVYECAFVFARIMHQHIVLEELGLCLLTTHNDTHNDDHTRRHCLSARICRVY